MSDITAMLSKDFMALVLIALVTATPISWLVVSKWLQNFAYRVNITVNDFLITGILVMVITLLTISFSNNKSSQLIESGTTK